MYMYRHVYYIYGGYPVSVSGTMHTSVFYFIRYA